MRLLPTSLLPTSLLHTSMLQTSLLAIAVAALLLPALAAAQTVTLGTGGKQVTITVGDDAILPADFPEDVFLFPDADLERVQQVDNGVVLLEFRTQATPAAIADCYAAAMSVAGWVPAQVTRVAGASAQAWEKDRRAVLVSAAPAEGGTRLWLQLRPRQAPATPAADGQPDH